MAVLPTTYERRWPSVILTPIAVANHKITVSSTKGLHTKQKVTLRLGANALTDIEIKRVLSDTEIQVGPLGAEMGNIINPVAYNGGTLEMSEQERNKVGNEITFRAVYEEEPAVALRTLMVDRMGAYIDSVVDGSGINRLAVDTVVSVGDIAVDIAYPTDIVVDHVPSPVTADTEFSIIIPANTKRFTLRTLEDQSSIKIAFSSGLSGTMYSKISPGETWPSGDLDLTGPLTIYAQTPKANMTVVVVRWTQ
jgi:hypothetical protein